MQSFTTSGPDHPFEVDGHKYVMPGLTSRDFDAITGFGILPTDDEKDEALRQLLADRAQRRHRFNFLIPPARVAVLSLSSSQTADLLTGWAQMKESMPGEL